MSNLKTRYDVIIVGAGVAGLNCALHIDDDKQVLIICKDSPDKSDSYLAQGGICRLIDDDDYDSYFEDTMRAGHYENNARTVECMIRRSQEIIDDLIACGVDFARNADGSLAYTKEGGHSKPRICYHKDTTGLEISHKLMVKVCAKSNVTLMPYTTMLDLVEGNNTAYGIVVKVGETRRIETIFADYIVLASGGLGGVFENSTNFRLLTGDALAICLNHGVAVDHINYIQIHPTTLYTKKEGRRFLISESVRGEGAHLLDKNFNRFTDELKPRDVVTAQILAKMAEDNTPHVWLDLRVIPHDEVESHFPTIVAECAKEGYDVFAQPIPVVPAQHYFMGGIRSDLDGRTTMNRLFAVGETCCNGVHGKNRLASNSLLESLLFAKCAAQYICAHFERGDISEGERVSANMDYTRYVRCDELLNSYHNIVRNAINEENQRK